MKKKALLILLVIATAVYAFAGDYDKYQTAKKDLAFIEKSSKVSRKSYENVASQFYSIYSSAPQSSLADDALHYTAQTYYRSYKRFNNRDDLLKTLKYLKLLAVNYETRLASLAYLQSADIYTMRKDFASAKFMLNRLLFKFPNSEDAPAARKKLEAIDAKFAKKNSAPDVEDIIKDTAEEPPVEQTAEEPAPEVQKVSTDSLFTDKTTSAAQESGGEKQYGGKMDAPSGKTMISGIRHFAASDYTRVVLDMSGPVNYKKHWLKANPKYNKPPRLFLDIETDVIDKTIPKEIDIKDGLLRSVRWGVNRPGVIRVVLDSDNVKDFNVFPMGNPDRIVIDVSGEPIKDRRDESPNMANQDADLDKATLASVFGLKIRRIVIDAGHGGKDPGATYNGLKEKDVVLDIALELERLFKENTQLEVFMTRRRDVFIPLEERTAFANRKKADIFISVHINASRNRNANGIETYVLNVTDDKAALALAAKENMATTKSMSDLQGILKDIMLNSKLEESLLLAGKAQEWLVKYVYGSSSHSGNRGVKQAPFYVLVGAQMPSILVEAGFISNRTEAKKYRSTNYRKKIAYGIYKGLAEYIEMHQ
ncbi:N-acetylmuramoyl-L-alanine amidase [Limisalsivibrio acetivorans]|uniref:N-acetylmuramoyl-L-alanine amidase n=1 Tax=Limisalsivibrio acetivorans TaxID=1304888 RepID=UPI0003B48E1E|nr:N-acetylmuramoyl-L-alanine amidase [Limisalsivibrio acetivorans]